jgi:hypothetical protein
MVQIRGFAQNKGQIAGNRKHIAYLLIQPQKGAKKQN